MNQHSATHVLPRTLLERHLQAHLHQLLLEEPVLILTGARAVGKSVLVKVIAQANGVPLIDLDDLATRNAVRADPSLFVAPETLVCIDEFQHVLSLLDAIKAELNRELRPGRYLLTGSTRYFSLPAASQALTGRAHIINLWPLSQGEIRGHEEHFLDRLMADPQGLVTAQESTTSRSDYESMVLAGGYPLALQRPRGELRRRWFRDYVNLVVMRDVLEIRKVRQRAVVPEVLRRLASQTGQVLNLTNLGQSIGVEQSTVNDYVQLLESVFLVHRLEAYGRTLSSRVQHAPKIHLVDSGLAAFLLGVTHERLAQRDPATLTEFGHLLETFTVNDILKQAGWSQIAVRFSHFRFRERPEDSDGESEVDIVCETDDGRVVGIEVKASSIVSGKDFKALRVLRDKLREQFIGGIVLSLGSRSYTVEDRLHVIPLDRLWVA